MGGLTIEEDMKTSASELMNFKKKEKQGGSSAGLAKRKEIIPVKMHSVDFLKRAARCCKFDNYQNDLDKEGFYWSGTWTM